MTILLHDEDRYAKKIHNSYKVDVYLLNYNDIHENLKSLKTKKKLFQDISLTIYGLMVKFHDEIAVIY